MAKVKEFPEIQLDNTFKVTYESQNWTLYRDEDTLDIKTKEYTGNFKWKNVGYFGDNFDQVLKRYVRESINDAAISSIHDVLDRLNEIDRNIEKIVKKENIKLVVKEND